MSEPKIDLKLFLKRLERFVDHWKVSENSNSGHFNKAEAIIVVNSKAQNQYPFTKTASIQYYLLGYEFTNTVMLFLKNKLIIYTSETKAKNLSGLSSLETNIPVEIVAFGKGEKEIVASFSKVKDAISDLNQKKIGMFIKDKIQGTYFHLFNKFKDEDLKDFEFVDASAGVSSLLAVKDNDELDDIRKATTIDNKTMKNWILPKIITYLDEKKRKYSNSSIVAQSLNFLTDNSFRTIGKVPKNVDVNKSEWAYDAIVQSGGEYDIKPSALTNKEQLVPGVILCSIGGRYNNYCSNMGRTFLVDATETQVKDFKFLLELQDYIMSILKIGVKFSEVYDKALNYVSEKRSDLIASFPKNIGFITGLEFRDNLMALHAKSTQVFDENMVISLNVALQNIQDSTASDPKQKKYSLLWNNTIHITKDGPVNLTDELGDISSIRFSLEFDREKIDATKALCRDPNEVVKSKVQQPKIQEKVQPSVSSTVLKSKLRSEDQEESKEMKMREHQRELFEKLQQESLERHNAASNKKNNSQKQTVKVFESYKKDNLFPVDNSSLSIYVDRRAFSVILPINGFAVPFHISTLKSLSKNEESEYIYIRLNFFTPGQGVAKKEDMPFADPNAHFIRSLTFRSTDTYRLTETFKKITDLKKEFAKREIDKQNEAEIVHQAKLITAGRGRSSLNDIYLRPAPEGKRMSGEVEIHANGIRYVHPRGNSTIDILFNNVKHLFFHPCENELIVLIHVHLKDPIMIGKKKTKDVQFYREASDARYDETGNRRRQTSYGDEDELEAEREEKARINELNKEFQNFSNKIAEAADGEIEVESPFRELAFSGVPFRSNVFLMPTGESLIHLLDPPFLVITLAEVELVHLERVQFSLKNFDMVFVFKDFTRTPVQINSIPMKKLDDVKEWLNSVDVVYTEGQVNLNWNTIMKTIRDNPDSFYADGGWQFLDANNDDDDDMSEESISDYVPDSDELNEGSTESDYDSEVATDEEEEDSEASEAGSEEEEEGLDWDELEEQAKRGDTQKRQEPEPSRNRPPVKKRR